MIRRASLSDIPAMVALSEVKRTEYATYQPLFWHKADDSAIKQKAYFEHLLKRPQFIMLVDTEGATLNGFIIAGVTPAPPVYDIGGLNCMIDDFCVANDKQWSTIGQGLLDEVCQLAHKQDAVQIVVVTGHHDQPKREFLQEAGLLIASEWYTKSISSQ